MKFTKTVLATWDNAQDVAYEHPSYPGFRALVHEITQEHTDMMLGKVGTDDAVLCRIETVEEVELVDLPSLGDEGIPSFFESADELGLMFKRYHLHDVLNFVTYQFQKQVSSAPAE